MSGPFTAPPPTALPLLTPHELRQALRVSKPTYRLLLQRGMPHILLTQGKARSRRRFSLDRVFIGLCKSNVTK
jgi:hypothetical protein